MRLDDCNLDVKLAVSAPMQRSAPEPVWVKAHDSGIIPDALFTLYTRASYLSFGSAPPFLDDKENLLFSYFAMVLNGLLEALSDADRELRDFIEAHSNMYDPVKKTRGESWDPSASEAARRHFTSLFISLEASLDCLADLVALFFTAKIHGLRLGRARFTKVDAWLSNPLQPSPGLVTPHQHFLLRLHQSLRPLVHPTGPDRDWLPLMRLYRNKVAHLSTAVFRYLGLEDKAGDIHVFLPRRWPFILERYMTLGALSTARVPGSFEQLCHDNLIHEDVIAFVTGLRARILDVLEVAGSVLVETYDLLKILKPNEAALAELAGSTEAHTFEYFPTKACQTRHDGSGPGGDSGGR